MRHDPDVVLVGEIRDLETAENAIQASLTGHLVFSTLHTNDAASAYTRLIDMGVEPFLVASTVEAVMAQRLIRRLCEQCKVVYYPTREEVPADFPYDQYKSSGQPIYQAVGCRACRGLGYTGRLGIYELLITNDKIRQIAQERTGTWAIKQAGIEAGMMTLRQNGWLKVMAGRSSIDEIMRMTKSDTVQGV
ncbi:MAG: ATPase, T2SS/T4P/T4SS family [Pirellulales bacterium]